MKFSNYIKYPALLSLMTLFTGCINDDMPSCQEETRSVPVKFTIVLSNNTQATRAEEAGNDVNAPIDDETWSTNPDSEDGFFFDNKIESAKVYIYSISPEGTLATDYLIGSMTASTIVGKEGTVAEDNTTNYSKYEIVGNLETTYPVQLLETGDFRMVVVANTGLDDISDLGSATFSRHGVPVTEQKARITNNTFSSIPMYGVGEVSFQGLSSTTADANGDKIFTLKNKSGDEISIPMLRSMAKIRVKVADTLAEERGVKLKRLMFSRHSENGYFVPNKWNSISSIYDLKLSESLNVVVNTGDDYPKDCVANTEGSGNGENMIRFYVPDTYNIDNTHQFHDHTEEGEIKLTVTYVSDDDEAEKTGEIYFRSYDENGKPLRGEGSVAWDIIRNHIYEYVIEGVEATTGNLQVNVKVNEWKDHDNIKLKY